MPHKGSYTKKELEDLKKQEIKPGSKSAHKVVKKRYRQAEGGVVKG